MESKILNVLVVDDESSIRRSTGVAVEAEGHFVETAESAEGALEAIRAEKFDIIFLDVRLGNQNGLDLLPDIAKRQPGANVVVFTAHATIDLAVRSLKEGAFDFIEKPFTPNQLRGAIARSQQTSRLKQRVEELETEVEKHSPPVVFETRDPPVEATLKTAFRAAPTPASILILGQSGTGKSVLAKAIHQRSHLADKSFVTVSCPSLSRELLESELFGHVKGAFTGAVKDQWGKVHAANGGTLFLDEIGELSPEIQPKLLRLLQEREYERLGEHKTRQADLRIIAATNRDLAAQVEEGLFREDLFYRLNVIEVTMPPLKERPGDLAYFAKEYLNFFAKQTGRKIDGFSDAARSLILNHDWPGNLRELRNAIERASILCATDQIEAADLPQVTGNSATDAGEGFVALGAEVSLRDVEKEHIRRVVANAESISHAAEVLGIDQSTLYRKRKDMGLG